MGRPADVPAYEPDLYSRQAIVAPYPHHARLRRLGPVVWLTKQRVYALPRYAECKAVLRDDTTFISGERSRAEPDLQQAVSRHNTQQ
jgi:cytochrome P450